MWLRSSVGRPVWASGGGSSTKLQGGSEQRSTRLVVSSKAVKVS
jgi:hypothetical protein